jgi:hypothetical protein
MAMAYVDWEFEGPEVTACNCEVGCPCQFNALPSHGDCRAAVMFRIERGHFGDVSLDGLCAGGMFAWPKAIHLGNGECLPLVDERADTAQRYALLSILSGAETEPGATIFNVFASTFTKVHDPQFVPIEFECDIAAGTGRFRVPGRVETTNTPIRNPVTGEPHRVSVRLAKGFEYSEAQFVQSQVRGQAPIPLGWDSGHGHLTRLHMKPSGVVRS